MNFFLPLGRERIFINIFDPGNKPRKKDYQTTRLYNKSFIQNNLSLVYRCTSSIEFFCYLSIFVFMTQIYTLEFINTIIRKAWADDISFDKIKKDHAISESEVIKIMRANLKAGSFKLWRKRVSGRSTKHEKRSKFLREGNFD